MLSGLNVVAFAADDASDDTIAIWCGYYAPNGDHLYRDEAEIDKAVAQNHYVKEDLRWYAPQESSTKIKSAWNQYSGEHLLYHDTDADNEFIATHPEWVPDAFIIYSDDEMGVPIYRMFNPAAVKADTHIYVTEDKIAEGIAYGYYVEDDAPFLYGVKEDYEVVGAEIDNETPSIGDTITAYAVNVEGEPVPGNYKYQWYRVSGADELMIKGANKASYTVGAADIGCSLYCIVTDADGDVYYTSETSKIGVQTITDVEITGFSGKSSEAAKKNDVAVIGDTLTAVTDPKDASDLVSYQWYRGESPIVGATSAKYTVQKDDWGNNLKVRIKAKDKEAVVLEKDDVEVTFIDSDATTLPICKNVSDLTATLSDKVIDIGENVTLTVKDGTTALDIGPIALTNEIQTKWFVGGKESLAVKNTDTSERAGLTDAGKEIKVEYSGNPMTGYFGTASLSAMVDAPEITGLTVSNIDNGVSVIGTGTTVANGYIGTTLSASAMYGANPVSEFATYEWTVSGTVVGTQPTLTLTRDMVGMDSAGNPVSNVKIQCVATGANGFSGTQKHSFTYTTVSKEQSLGTYGVVDVTDPTTAITDATGMMYAGKTYTAVPNVVSAQGLLNTKWFYTTTSDTVNYQSQDGATFTVPDDINTAGKIFAVTYYKGDATDAYAPANNNLYWATEPTWTVNGTPALVPSSAGSANPAQETTGYYYLQSSNGTAVYSFVPKKSLESVSIAYDNNASANKMAANYKAYEGPEVGAWAHATVKPSVGAAYFWYAVDEVNATTIDWIAADILGGGANALDTSKDYQITEDEYGLQLVCVAVGTATGYQGSKTFTISAPVAASSRQVAGIMVVNTSAPTVQVTSMEAGETYLIVAKDTNGEYIVANNGALFVWDGTESDVYLNYPNFQATWTAVGGTGINTVMVVPDQINYVGNPASYTFATEVEGEEEELGISYRAAGTYTNLLGTQVVAAQEAVTADLESTSGVSAKSIQWYKATSLTSVGVAIAGEDDLELNAANVNDGSYYYVVITGQDGTLYTGKRILAETRAVDEIDPDELTDGTSAAHDVGVITAYDQFGDEFNGATVVIVGDDMLTPSTELEVTNNGDGTYTVTQDADGATAGTYYVLLDGEMCEVTIEA